MNYEREDYMRRQEAEHDMIRMRDPRYRPRLHTQGSTRNAAAIVTPENARSTRFAG